jgi:hypothetical protein
LGNLRGNQPSEFPSNLSGRLDAENLPATVDVPVAQIVSGGSEGEEADVDGGAEERKHVAVHEGHRWIPVAAGQVMVKKRTFTVLMGHGRKREFTVKGYAAYLKQRAERLTREWRRLEVRS